MDARFYNSEEIDIDRLANDLENIYRVQGYQVQQLGNGNQVMVQLKKGGDLEALIGLQAALSVILQRSAGGVVAMIGQQKWIDKAAVGAVDGAACYQYVFEIGCIGGVFFAAAGLHADAVVAGADIAFKNNHVLTGADIDAIAVLRPPLIEYVDGAHGQVAAVIGIKNKFG